MTLTPAGALALVEARWKQWEGLPTPTPAMNLSYATAAKLILQDLMALAAIPHPVEDGRAELIDDLVNAIGDPVAFGVARAAIERALSAPVQDGFVVVSRLSLTDLVQAVWTWTVTHPDGPAPNDAEAAKLIGQVLANAPDSPAPSLPRNGAVNWRQAREDIAVMPEDDGVPTHVILRTAAEIEQERLSRKALPHNGAEPVASFLKAAEFVQQYGGRCRDCADHDGVCPRSGLPCADADTAIEHVMVALDYGIKNGFIANPFAAPAVPSAAPMAVAAPRIEQAQKLIDWMRDLIDNQPEGSAVVLVQSEKFNRIVGVLANLAAQPQNEALARIHKARADALQAAVPSAAIEARNAVIEAARDLVASRSETYRAGNNRQVSLQDENGEKMWIVPFDEMDGLERAVSAALQQRPQ